MSLRDRLLETDLIGEERTMSQSYVVGANAFFSKSLADTLSAQMYFPREYRSIWRVLHIDKFERY